MASLADKTRTEAEKLIAPVSGIVASANAVAGRIAETNAVQGAVQIELPSGKIVQAECNQRAGDTDMRTKAIVAGLVAAAAIATAGAASGPILFGPASAHVHGDKRGFAAGEPGDPRKPSRTVEILMTDGPGTMAYMPDRLEVKRGEQIRFVLKNVGMVGHEFLIDSFANNAKHKKEMEERPDMAHTEPNGARLKPNATAEILWRFTKAGTYEFACLIPGHYETGMKGTFIVK